MQDYGIVFSGDVCEGVSTEEARDNLARLLRIQDAARLDRLFNGKPVVLKKGLDETQANRYEQALRQAGVRCERRRLPAAAPAADATQTTAASASASAFKAGPAQQNPEREIATLSVPSLSLAATEATEPATRRASHTSAPADAAPGSSDAATPAKRTLSLEPLSLVPTEEAPADSTTPEPAARPFATPSSAGLSAGASSTAISPKATSALGMPTVATSALATGAVATSGMTASTGATAINATGAADAPAMRHTVVKGSGAGYGDSSIVPDEIRGLCWGGFFLPWIWGGFNGVRISFLALPGMGILRRLLPRSVLLGLSLLLSFFMLFKGRELAWQNRPWDSAEHFNRVQRRWTMGGLAFALLLTLTVPSCVAHEKKHQAALAAEMARIEAERAGSGDEPALRAREATLGSMQDSTDTSSTGQDSTESKEP